MADEPDKIADEPSKKNGGLHDLVKAESMIQLALAIPAGCLIGWLLGSWLDRHFHQGWIAITGIVLGAVGGFIQIYRHRVALSERRPMTDGPMNSTNNSFPGSPTSLKADFKRTIWSAIRLVAIAVVVGVPLLWWKLGWQSAVLLVVGAVISGSGLYEWLRLMTAVMVRMDSGGDTPVPVRPLAAVLIGFFLRLGFALVLLYGSLKLLDGSVYALVAGSGAWSGRPFVFEGLPAGHELDQADRFRADDTRFMLTQLLFTRFLNAHFAAPVDALLRAVHVQPQFPDSPISNTFAMESLVFAGLLVWLLYRRPPDAPRWKSPRSAAAPRRNDP